jgi:hypothetical protein
VSCWLLLSRFARIFIPVEASFIEPSCSPEIKKTGCIKVTTAVAIPLHSMLRLKLEEEEP